MRLGARKSETLARHPRVVQDLGTFSRVPVRRLLVESHLCIFSPLGERE